MKTSHRVLLGDSRETLPDDSVDLVVTSPPYPMIEMWDSVFSTMNDEIESKLDSGEGDDAFELMHKELDKVWENIDQCVQQGGIVCVNIGDATRKLDDDFQVYSNHSRIIQKFKELGFNPLPEILWRKPSNKKNKFMGSGMLPTNAYVTLEHEYILVFRKGGVREFEPYDTDRYESAYFWEERNEWFSDVWMNLTGTRQSVEDASRDRSAAYPIELPYRLINMFSVYGDTVFDPFWGTGTTTQAAIAAGRDSIGIEIKEDFIERFDSSVNGTLENASKLLSERVDSHIEFMEDVSGHSAENHGFGVKTQQESNIRLVSPDTVEREVSDEVYEYTVKHSKFEINN